MLKILTATSVIVASAMMCSLPVDTALAACMDGKNRNITIVNNSRRTVESVHATNVRNDNWGPDILPGTIEPGERVTVDADDGSCRCKMDLKAISGRIKWEKFNIDVCAADTWRLGN